MKSYKSQDSIPDSKLDSEETLRQRLRDLEHEIDRLTDCEYARRLMDVTGYVKNVPPVSSSELQEVLFASRRARQAPQAVSKAEAVRNCGDPGDQSNEPRPNDAARRNEETEQDPVRAAASSHREAAGRHRRTSRTGGKSFARSKHPNFAKSSLQRSRQAARYVFAVRGNVQGVRRVAAPQRQHDGIAARVHRSGECEDRQGRQPKHYLDQFEVRLYDENSAGPVGRAGP